MSKNIVETAREAGSFTTLLAGSMPPALATHSRTAARSPCSPRPTRRSPSSPPAPSSPARRSGEADHDPHLPRRPRPRDCGGRRRPLVAPTVQGDDLPISIDGGIHVADANVVSADIEAANGVIHVIDRELLPAAA